MLDTLATHFLPDLVAPEELAGATVVVIDVLRATTTITYALAAGAREVIPCLEIDEARRIAAKQSIVKILTGGEREGGKIEGFDLGNSPSEYREEAVQGRTIVFTTTNGTRAMNRCREAARVVIGAFVNLSALAAALPAEGSVHLLCAGTGGRITREDVLLAGAIAARLLVRGTVDETAFNDQARIAHAAWWEGSGAAAWPTREHKAGIPGREALFNELRLSQGGRNLTALGMERDINDAARIDLFRSVGELNIANWRITLSQMSNDE